jgi:hypothetical protein
MFFKGVNTIPFCREATVTHNGGGVANKGTDFSTIYTLWIYHIGLHRQPSQVSLHSSPSHFLYPFHISPPQVLRTIKSITDGCLFWQP